MPLFQDLTEDQVARLDGLMRQRAFPAGANIISVEQPGEVVYVLLTGTVKIQVDQADGSNVILAILGPGDTVGELSMIDSLGRSANVVTLEQTTALWMERNTFRDCLMSIPTMALNVMRILSRRLRLANAQIQSLAALDVYGRVARQILAFATEYGQPTPKGDTMIPLRLTQSDLADIVGATRVRVNQALVYYKESKSISVDQNFRITVHDAKALALRCQ
jgi:CRP/FNR family cyclic AMP-dependent transcriptional regulator